MIRRSVQNLKPYTPGEQPKIPNLIKLNTNENAYPPSPRVAEALQHFSPESLNRYPDPMCTQIRIRLAELNHCAPENIFVGNGSDEVLRLATQAWVEDDESIGYFNPSYSLYPVLAEIRDVAHVGFPLPTNSTDFAYFFADTDQNEEKFRTLLPPSMRLPRLFFLANPNAPTSTHFRFGDVLTFCKPFGGVVVIDEAYADFAEENCGELPRLLTNAVVCRTLSKAWSLAGIRLGYFIGPQPLIESLYKIKDSYNVNALTQCVALAALSDPDWMLQNRNKIIQTRTRLTNELRSLGWVVPSSSTNFLWCTPPASLTALAVKDRLREKGIIIRHFPGPLTGDKIRITIGTDPQTDALLDVLKSL